MGARAREREREASSPSHPHHGNQQHARPREIPLQQLSRRQRSPFLAFGPPHLAASLLRTGALALSLSLPSSLPVCAIPHVAHPLPPARALAHTYLLFYILHLPLLHAVLSSLTLLPLPPAPLMLFLVFSFAPFRFTRAAISLPLCLPPCHPLPLRPSRPTNTRQTSLCLTPLGNTTTIATLSAWPR